MSMSDELIAGINNYNARITALGGYGVRITARTRGPKGTVRAGRLIELGWGGCQPGLVDDDGRRWAIELSTVEGEKS